MIKQYRIHIESKKRRELIDISEKINKMISEEKDHGLLNVFVPHTTAGVIINENESGLKNDIIKTFEKIVPENGDYEHNLIDNNADAHLLSIILKNSVNIPFVDGKLLLGTWQSIFFVELDGPRQRNIIITAIS